MHTRFADNRAESARVAREIERADGAFDDVVVEKPLQLPADVMLIRSGGLHKASL